MTPVPIAPRRPAGKLTVTKAGSGFQISEDIARQMRRCRASVRTAIGKQLAEIAASAGKGRRHGKALDHKGPPLRFYVYDGYRIDYQLDPGTGRVIVLGFEPVSPG